MALLIVFLPLVTNFLTYFIKRQKKAAKTRKRQIVNCLSKQLRPNVLLTMFTQTLYEEIKRFQSHFPREVVYVEKEVTVNLDFFSFKIF